MLKPEPPPPTLPPSSVLTSGLKSAVCETLNAALRSSADVWLTFVAARVKCGLRCCSCALLHVGISNISPPACNSHRRPSFTLIYTFALNNTSLSCSAPSLSYRFLMAWTRCAHPGPCPSYPLPLQSPPSVDRRTTPRLGMSA